MPPRYIVSRFKYNKNVLFILAFFSFGEIFCHVCVKIFQLYFLVINGMSADLSTMAISRHFFELLDGRMKAE